MLGSLYFFLKAMLSMGQIMLPCGERIRREDNGSRTPVGRLIMVQVGGRGGLCLGVMVEEGEVDKSQEYLGGITVIHKKLMAEKRKGDLQGSVLST